MPWNQKSYSEALEWQPHWGTQFFIFDREDFTLVQRGEAPAWFQWHFANGCLISPTLIRVQLVRYADFATNEYLREISRGQPVTQAPGHLWELEFDLAVQSQIIWRRLKLAVTGSDIPKAQRPSGIEGFGYSVLADSPPHQQS